MSSEQNYKLQFIEKMELFLKIMRWRAILYDNGCKQNRNEERYRLKKLQSPK